MNPVVFECNGVLPDDRYLPGQYSWRSKVLLLSALLNCRPPASGALTLTLEVGGVLTPLAFRVPASGGAVDEWANKDSLSQLLDLRLIVPAGSPIRWKAAYDGPVEDAASLVSVTVMPAAYTEPVWPTLSVLWVNQKERLTLFRYDPLTHQFAEAQPGLAASRAGISVGDVTSISLQAVEVLRVAEAKLSAAAFNAFGPTFVPDSPRLEFLVDSKRVATLTKAGVLWVAQIVEAAPAVLTPDCLAFHTRFEFYSSPDGVAPAALTAVLSAEGLTATAIQEPL